MYKIFINCLSMVYGSDFKIIEEFIELNKEMFLTSDS